MKDKVCVTGGSGGIGQALLEQLVDLYDVKALFRSKTKISDKWEQRGCTPVWGDLGNEQALSELSQGAKFVFHCAALVTKASYQESYAVNVEGTRQLARIAAANGCERFIHISSVAVYSGTTTEGDYTEDINLNAHDEMAVYSSTKLQSELALREIAQEHSLAYTILRPTCVYGPDTKSYTLVPITLIRKGIPIMLGAGQGLLDVVYVDDVARAMLLAAKSPQAAGEVFNIGHETTTLKDFYSHYSSMLSRPVRHLPITYARALVKLLGFAAPTSSVQDVRKGARFLIKMAENIQRFPSSKAAKLLGYAPQFSLGLGMLKTELWLKQQRLIPEIPYSLDFYGVLSFRPQAIVHPGSEEELVEIIRLAQKQQVRVKAIGSLHSQCPIPETDGICIVLDKYNKLLKLDGSFVTVQAGMKLKELNEILATHDLALPIVGNITAQTVSGAISTATHGGSVHYGTLSDYVESIRIVKADGTIEEIHRSHEVFPGVVVSLGLLGVISAVTFRCVPSFALQSLSSVRDVQDVLDNFDELHQGNLYTDMLYFPSIDQIAILSVNKIEKEQCKLSAYKPVETVKRPQQLGHAKLKRQLTIMSLRAGAWLVQRSDALQRYSAKLSAKASYQPRTDRSDLVLAFGERGDSGRSPGIIRDMEVAVPYEHARTVIALLRNHFLTTRKYPILPIHIRCSPRSDLWLSPAYGRDVCWFECWQYPRTDSFLEQIHELLVPFHYRFHWGKETLASREYIEQQYEKWNDFVQLREAWDGRGMFLNSYLESFFAEPKGSGS